MSRQRASSTYRKYWRELIARYGARCFYCRKQMATCIDHVVPHSFDQDNTIENLVPSCTLCNLLASDKHFDSAWQKRQYILEMRKRRRNSQVICTDCLLPFAYRVHSPSLFLCAECYDDDYRTKYSERPEWGRWKIQLLDAGIPPEAHQALRMEIRQTKGIVWKLDMKLDLLVDEYAKIFDSDENFAKLMIRP